MVQIACIQVFCKYILIHTISENYLFSVLHWCAINGHFEFLKTIIDKVEEKLPRDKDGSTPLHFAAEFGHEQVYKMIMDVVQHKNPENRTWLTPLHLAARNNHEQICKLILENIVTGDFF